MIVRTLAEAEKTDRRVVAENGNWQSVRLSLKEDKMGHSFNITTIFKGTKTHIKYANHWESVYVISGKGKIEMVESGDVYELTPGTI
ncbi:MAG TPA: L-ectoine synthase, partial [Alcanivorax sp.]|nr:L-ectoine synthase [Alcanivorax sp.]